ncbi:hypothetical protein F5Y18DRAFT_386461 [Xylariaceae sp. FL1019]|nr:hypothetical protein F5Y18DRAFT_386461 [Xylariaceae sp. FL1019]
MTAVASQWHPGELAMHRTLHVPTRDNPTVDGLKEAHGYRVAVSPLVAFGTLDEEGRPWATVWGGEKGFTRPVAENVLGVNANPGAWDPVLEALLGRVKKIDGKEEDEIVRPEGGKVMAALSLDLETRDRVKLAGKMIAGVARKTGEGGVKDLQMAFSVEGALGNCPKYLNKKTIRPAVPKPVLVKAGKGGDVEVNGQDGEIGLDKGLPLPEGAMKLIKKADLFFIASKHGDGSMDVNTRGGAPGFLRVYRNQKPSASSKAGGEAPVSLVYPEYSGNRLYQTLGNLREDPVAGLVVPDFETGDVLYLTGKTTILVAEKAAAYIPRAKLAIRIDVVEARFVRQGLPFRGDFIDYSPYNPPVRKLISERKPGEAEDDGNANVVALASLTSREVLTNSISRYTFKVSPPPDARGAISRAETGERKKIPAWYPGQHVTFDFSSELDSGYSHMRDDDPQSLNDDFVRTFTVSAPLDHESVETVISSPGTDAAHGHEERCIREDAEPEMEIVVRRHGPATELLAKWNLRVPLEIPIMGFGGVEEFRMPTAPVGDGKESVFVAGGVGITPLLAQAKGVLGAEGKGRLKVLWSLKAEDLKLAKNVFEKIEGLVSVTKVFVTGARSDEGVGELMGVLKMMGAEVVERRMEKGDVSEAGTRGERKFYCCTGPAMMKTLLQFLEGEEVVFESFEY